MSVLEWIQLIGLATVLIGILIILYAIYTIRSPGYQAINTLEELKRLARVEILSSANPDAPHLCAMHVLGENWIDELNLERAAINKQVISAEGK